MISDVVAGVYTYLFMREYNQFKKDIVAGKYNDVKGSFKCSLCARGKYQNELGKSECKFCPLGQCGTLLGRVYAFLLSLLPVLGSSHRSVLDHRSFL